MFSLKYTRIKFDQNERRIILELRTWYLWPSTIYWRMSMLNDWPQTINSKDVIWFDVHLNKQLSSMHPWCLEMRRRFLSSRYFWNIYLLLSFVLHRQIKRGKSYRNIGTAFSHLLHFSMQPKVYGYDQWNDATYFYWKDTMGVNKQSLDRLPKIWQKCKTSSKIQHNNVGKCYCSRDSSIHLLRCLYF